MDKLLSQSEFDKLVEDVAHQYARTLPHELNVAYAAALARIITLEAQIDAMREQVDRLLSEAAHA